jgi:hypothetical protein
MQQGIVEVSYPLDFRKKDAIALGEHLRHRHSVDIVGMKRVGISNFLRYFLYRSDVVYEYMSREEKFLFIPIDLNDLVEREIYPFWALTMKRIVDTIERSELPGLDKKKIENRFLSSIQSQDLFLVIDSVRQSLVDICNIGTHPTLFFLRFDRMRDVVTPQFFDNLNGLKDATHQKVAYVFTSYRSLDNLSPVFTTASLSLFSHVVNLKPADEQDMNTIYNTYRKKYNLTLTPAQKKAILELAAGNVQYLQFALIIMNEKRNDKLTPDEVIELVRNDERVMLYSEEVWESLTADERGILMKIKNSEILSAEDKKKGQYLWDMGLVVRTGGKDAIFSDLLSKYIEKHEEKNATDNQAVHMSKKEHSLFTLLEKHVDEICERDTIIEEVWPEYREYGVSDWAIDRLVARVRSKLKQQGSPYKIVTIRTRGYTLTAS